MGRIHLAAALAFTAGLTFVGCSSEEPEGVGANTDDAVESTLHSFECETQDAFYDGVVHSMSFSVRSLERPQSIDFEWDEDADEWAVVHVLPEDSWLTGLNDNWGIEVDDGKLTIDGDSDGFHYSKLVLYEDSGFTKGYVKLEDGGGFIGGDYYSKISCTVSETKPTYDLDTDHILGVYGGEDWCSGGFDACVDAEIRAKEEGGYEIELGGGQYWDGYMADLHESNGVLLFSTGDRYDDTGPDFDDCDDPGCGNVLKISGVIYPKKIDGQWVPTIKSYYTIDFPFPDEEEAPEGILKHRSYLFQATE